jgi:D-serine deaminase-like pyridoxal phosphate-dependent protein
MDFLSEEHGVGHRSGGDDLRIGDRLQVIPSHACTCVNLFDLAYGVRRPGRTGAPHRRPRQGPLTRAGGYGRL